MVVIQKENFIMSKLSIALVSPPIIGHKFRGTGEYTTQLYESLKEYKNIDVSLVEVNDHLDKFDLVHFPYFDQFFLTLPILRTYKNVVTVHDLIPLAFPEHFPKGIRGTIKWQIQKISLLRSDAILTDSFASKGDILKYTTASEDKVHIVPLGVRKEFQVTKNAELLNNIKKKLKIPDNFILHVGDVNYNKNIIGLIKAFSYVTAEYKIFLVLVGRGFIEYSSQLNKINNLITELGMVNRIVKLGHISLDELIALYNLAKAYIQPSFAEGFGLPVLEAMACGCPTIVSKTSSLTELVGDASIMVNPHDEKDIAKGILEILNNETKQQEIIKKGLQRASKFSWDKCAEETVKIYKSIILKVH